MPRPFVQLSVEQFAERLAEFEFRRRISEVHMHHTEIPDGRAWRAHHLAGTEVAVIEGMDRFHREVRGFNDIAQHVTIAPDGTIWTGRDWNRPPASATGHNGSADAIPFMFETIGNFDGGREQLDGVQRAAVIEVIARVQLAFGLPAEKLRFHNEMSGKTCPGNGPTVRKEQLIEEVRQRRDALVADGMVAEALVRRSRGRGVGDEDDVTDGELDHGAMSDAERAIYFPAPGAAPRPSGTRGGSGMEESRLSHEDVTALRPHVINMTDGRFKRSGIYDTTEGDVRAIFAEHLPRWEAARGSEPLRLVFWAHGGLVDEKSGLAVARKHVDWWKANGVYPIYFVWETGLFDALRSILDAVKGRVRPRGRRDLWDHTSDPVIEAGARALGGVKVWSAMKDDAVAANAEGGGAEFVARRLKEFLDAQGRPVKMHAVGHSAGSIFHAHFLPMAMRLGIDPFDSLQLLAPAIRVDDFLARMTPDDADAGQAVVGAQSLTLYTMRRDLERRDQCAGLYRKSLLYLIHHALEREPETPILGLEQSIFDEPRLLELFGLDNRSKGRGKIVWSDSDGSRSRSHGGFDDDATTMTTVASVVLGGSAPAQPYRAQASRGSAAWEQSDAWLEPFDLSGQQASADDDDDGAEPAAEGTRAKRPPASSASRRFALCVGINAYAGQPLEGCVADAEAWGELLEKRDFSVRYLRDREATYDRIRQELERMLEEARSGDVLVFQYAGHGTRVPDRDGEEDDDMDEAIVPFDHEEGALLIDDDFREIFSRVPDGVSLTCFMDCCHSGSNTRVFGSNTSKRAGKRARYLKPTDALIKAHAQFRALSSSDRFGSRGSRGSGGSGGSGGSRASGGGRAGGDASDRESMHWVSFAACEPWEVALESDGHGDFTRIALPILERERGAGLTYRELQRRILDGFGAAREQSPRLDCNSAAEALEVFQGAPPSSSGSRPIAGAKSNGNGSSPSNGKGSDPRHELARLVHQMEDVVSRL